MKSLPLFFATVTLILTAALTAMAQETIPLKFARPIINYNNQKQTTFHKNDDNIAQQCATSSDPCSDLACTTVLWPSLESLTPLPPTFSPNSPLSSFGQNYVKCVTDSTSGISSIYINLDATTTTTTSSNNYFASGAFWLSKVPANFPLGSLIVASLPQIHVNFYMLPGSAPERKTLTNFAVNNTEIFTANNGKSTRQYPTPDANLLDLRALPNSLSVFSLTYCNMSCGVEFTGLTGFPFNPQFPALFNFSNNMLVGAVDATSLPPNPFSTVDFRNNPLLASVWYCSMVPKFIAQQAILIDEATTNLTGTWCAAPTYLAEDIFHCRQRQSTATGEYYLDMVRVYRSENMQDLSLHDSIEMLVSSEYSGGGSSGSSGSSNSQQQPTTTTFCTSRYQMTTRFIDITNLPSDRTWAYFRSSSSFAAGLYPCAPEYTQFVAREPSLYPTLAFKRFKVSFASESNTSTGTNVVVVEHLPDVEFGTCPNFYGPGYGVYFSAVISAATDPFIFVDLVVFGELGLPIFRVFTASSQQQHQPQQQTTQQCEAAWPFLSVAGTSEIYNARWFLDTMSPCLPKLIVNSSGSLVPVTLPWATITLQPGALPFLILTDSAGVAFEMHRYSFAPVFNASYASLTATTTTVTAGTAGTSAAGALLPNAVTLVVSNSSTSLHIVYAGQLRAARNCTCPIVLLYQTPPLNGEPVHGFRPFEPDSFTAFVKCVAASCAFPEALHLWKADSSGVYQTDRNERRGPIWLSNKPQMAGKPFEAAPNHGTWFNQTAVSQPVAQDLVMCGTADFSKSHVAFAVDAKTSLPSMLYLQQESLYTTLFECGPRLVGDLDNNNNNNNNNNNSSMSTTATAKPSVTTIWTSNSGEVRDFDKLLSNTLSSCIPQASNVELLTPLVSATILIDDNDDDDDDDTSTTTTGGGFFKNHAQITFVDSRKRSFSLATKACTPHLQQGVAQAWDTQQCSRRNRAAAQTTSNDKDKFYRNVIWRPISDSSSSSSASSGTGFTAGIISSDTCFDVTTLFRPFESTNATTTVIENSCFRPCFTNSQSCFQSSSLLLDVALCYAANSLSPATIPLPQRIQRLLDQSNSAANSNGSIVVPPSACRDDDVVADASSNSNNNTTSSTKASTEASRVLAAVLSFIRSFNNTPHQRQHQHQHEKEEQHQQKHQQQIRFICDSNGQARVVSCTGDDDSNDTTISLDLFAPYVEHGVGWTRPKSSHSVNIEFLCTPCTPLIGLDNVPISMTIVAIGALVNVMLVVCANRFINPIVAPRIVEFRHWIAGKLELSGVARGLSRARAEFAIQQLKSRRAKALQWELRQSFEKTWLTSEQVEHILEAFGKAVERAAIADGSVTFTDTEPQDSNNNTSNNNQNFSHGAHHTRQTNPTALYTPIDSSSSDAMNSPLLNNNNSNLDSCPPPMQRATTSAAAAASTTVTFDYGATTHSASDTEQQQPLPNNNNDTTTTKSRTARARTTPQQRATRRAFIIIVRDRLLNNNRLPPAKLSHGSLARFVKLYAAVADQIASRSFSGDHQNDDDDTLANMSSFLEPDEDGGGVVREIVTPTQQQQQQSDQQQHQQQPKNKKQQLQQRRSPADFISDSNFINVAEFAAADEKSGRLQDDDDEDDEGNNEKKKQQRGNTNANDDDDDDDDNHEDDRQSTATTTSSVQRQHHGHTPTRKSKNNNTRSASTTDNEDAVVAALSNFKFTDASSSPMQQRGALSARAWSAPNIRSSFFVKVEECLVVLERDSSIAWQPYELQKLFLFRSLLLPPMWLMSFQLLAVLAYFFVSIFAAVRESSTTFFSERNRGGDLALYQLIFFRFFNSSWPSALIVNRLFSVIYGEAVFSNEGSAKAPQINKNSTGDAKSNDAENVDVKSAKILTAFETATALESSVATYRNQQPQQNPGAPPQTQPQQNDATQQQSQQPQQQQEQSDSAFLARVSSALVRDVFFLLPTMLMLPALITHVFPSLVVFLPVFLFLALLQLAVVFVVRKLPAVPFEDGQAVLTRGPGLKAFIFLILSRSFTFFIVCIVLRTALNYSILFVYEKKTGWAETIVHEFETTQSLDCAVAMTERSVIGGLQHFGSLFA